MKFTRFVFILSVALLAGGAVARAGNVVLVVHPGSGLKATVSVQVPQGWSGTVVPTPNMPVEVWLKTPAATLEKNATALLHFVFVTDWNLAMATRKTVDDQLVQANDVLLGDAVEKKMTLVELKSASGFGVYSVFTLAKYAGKKTVPKGEYRYMVEGLFVLKETEITFEVQLNDLNAPEFQQALKVVREGVAAEAAK